MTLTLVATVGGSTSNSYCDVTAADSYFEGRAFSSSWTGADDDTKTVALVHATSLLEREKWKGTKGQTPGSAVAQSLSWPRRWAPTLEADSPPDFIAEYFIDLTVGFYSELTIPVPIVRATCELALEIIRAGTTDPFTRDSTRNVKRKTVDVLTTEFFDVADRARGLGLFPAVAALVAPLLRQGDAAEVVRA